MHSENKGDGDKYGKKLVRKGKKWVLNYFMTLFASSILRYYEHTHKYFCVDGRKKANEDGDPLAWHRLAVLLSPTNGNATYEKNKRTHSYHKSKRIECLQWEK